MRQREEAQSKEGKGKMADERRGGDGEWEGELAVR